MLHLLKIYIIRIISCFYTFNINRKISLFKNGIYNDWIKCFLPYADRSCSFTGKGTFLNFKNIIIGEKTKIGKNFVITANKENSIIQIGSFCNIGEDNHITAIGKITIGNGVLTGRRVTISDNNHGSFEKKDLLLRPWIRELTSKGDVKIYDNVWIGENAVILSGVTIGEGAIIAANAVVTKNIPPFSLAAGIPAKVIKEINDKHTS